MSDIKGVSMPSDEGGRVASQRDALGRVYSQKRREFLAYVRTRLHHEVGRHHDPEDIIVSAVRTLQRSLNAGSIAADDDESMASVFWSVLRRKLADRVETGLRASRREELASEEEIRAFVSDKTGVWNDARALVQQIGRLDPASRAILLRNYLDDQSQGAIGEELGLSRDQVKRLAARAKVILRLANGLCPSAPPRGDDASKCQQRVAPNARSCPACATVWGADEAAEALRIRGASDDDHDQYPNGVEPERLGAGGAGEGEELA